MKRSRNEPHLPAYSNLHVQISVEVEGVVPFNESKLTIIVTPVLPSHSLRWRRFREDKIEEIGEGPQRYLSVVDVGAQIVCEVKGASGSDFVCVGPVQLSPKTWNDAQRAILCTQTHISDDVARFIRDVRVEPMIGECDVNETIDDLLKLANAQAAMQRSVRYCEALKAANAELLHHTQALREDSEALQMTSKPQPRKVTPPRVALSALAALPDCISVLLEGQYRRLLRALRTLSARKETRPVPTQMLAVENALLARREQRLLAITEAIATERRLERRLAERTAVEQQLRTVSEGLHHLTSQE